MAPIVDDFSGYKAFSRSGGTPEEACRLAITDGKDFFFQIRMLRAVFGLDLGAARDVAAMINSVQR